MCLEMLCLFYWPQPEKLVAFLSKKNDAPLNYRRDFQARS